MKNIFSPFKYVNTFKRATNQKKPNIISQIFIGLIKRWTSLSKHLLNTQLLANHSDKKNTDVWDTVMLSSFKSKGQKLIEIITSQYSDEFWRIFPLRIYSTTVRDEKNTLPQEMRESVLINHTSEDVHHKQWFHLAYKTIKCSSNNELETLKWNTIHFFFVLNKEDSHKLHMIFKFFKFITWSF